MDGQTANSTPKPLEGAREMLLSDLTATYHPIYPEGLDWQQVADWFYTEEPEHMRLLTESLRKTGWREPIQLSESEQLTEGSPPSVFNGTHRVAVALQEGWQSVPVTTQTELELTEGSYDEALFAQLHVRLTAGSLSEEEDWSIFDLLRSFPLTEELWVTSDIGSGALNSWLFVYDLQGKALESELETKALQMLTAAYPGRSFDADVRYGNELDLYYDEEQD